MKKQEKKYIVGVDLGGTKTAVGIITIRGHLVTKAQEETKLALGPQGVIKQMIDMTKSVLASAGITKKEIIGIGIAAAGPIDLKKGEILSPPNLPGWDRVQLVKPFKDSFRLPVYLDNDANAAALGEWVYGAGKGCKNMVYLTISTGIGGGIIIDGKLYHGANANAGEIGHMSINQFSPKCGCGNLGCLEAHSSGTSVAKRAKERLMQQPEIGTEILKLANNDINQVTAKIVFTAARQGDKLANELVDEFSFNLGVGLANVVNIFNPERIILGGGVMKSYDLFLDKVKEVVKSRALKPLWEVCEILPAALGDNVGIYGACAVVLTNIKK